jgi:(1->4)-alpha-D-glucan 1-alpha-D-glucosylmutase
MDFRATYRLQLTPEQDFAAVGELVPYLRDLGISHLYLSPALQARAGSTHGYDVVDPTRVSDALGGEAGLRALRDRGLGILLDIVPNHMGVSDENRWWSDERLRARFFDWDPDSGWYRRFFDIDDLAGIRVEDDEVFETVHGKVLELVAGGVLDGLRVDHPDGLVDPAGYLWRLRRRGVEHVWVEKILHPGEPLRDWPVEGTVGYEFLNDATALFVDRAAQDAMTRVYADQTGEAWSFEEVALDAQIEQATTTFAREVARLRELHDVPGMADALAALPVYRTYVEPWSGRVEDADREAIAAARMDARLERALLLQTRTPAAMAEFVTRFQQTSPPVTAKGIEDTAYYRYLRLLALNEVGGDPARFGISIEEFHAGNEQRALRSPRGLLVTQTHDTKRGGDVRARLGVLSACPQEWGERVRHWRAVTEELRRDGEGGRAPDHQEQYLIFQTLLGAWPIDARRLEAYLEKALRERKVTTSWVDQNHDWERRVQAYATALLSHRPFLADFEPFARRIAQEGRRSALAQQLLKLTAPGLPDVYQGDELEALNLVDPDNRRPVDWDQRRASLRALTAGAEPDEQTMKQFLIWKALDLRARRPDPFAGVYDPIASSGGVCAYARGAEVLTVVGVRDFDGAELDLGPRLAGRWRDVLTGEERSLRERQRVAGLISAYGIALLERT